MLSETSHTTKPSSRRLVRVFMPCLLALVLLGLLVWPGLAFNFSNNFLLSTRWAYDAAHPDVEAAGDYVAAVWSEGYNSAVGTKEWGDIYLKSGHRVDGWEGRVKVFDATNNAWGREARLVFGATGSTLHIVWAQASGCSTVVGGTPQCKWQSIRYTTCSLNGDDTCATPTTIATGLNDASTPSLAVASSGKVHVVWRDGSNSIKYCMKDACSSPQTVGSGQHPSLVLANSRLHVVWDAGSAINYRRDDNPADGAWSANPSVSRAWSAFATAGYVDPGFPTIGARGSAIYVAWAVKKQGTNEYAMAFDFHNGSAWRDTSGQNIGFTVPGNDQNFLGTARYQSDSAVSYLESLKPDIVVTDTVDANQVYAHLVWHGKQTGGESSGPYEIWYTYLAGIGASDWISPVIKIDNHSADDAGDPALAIGSVLSETHVVLMQDADGAGTGGTDRPIDVWYIGAFGNRDNDSDLQGVIFLPTIFKNAG